MLASTNAFCKWVAAASLATSLVSAQRPMENLGRGLVAVRSSDSDILITWRLLGLDPEDVGFNIYRNSELLNDGVLTEGTNFVDSSADTTVDIIYEVRPVTNGGEQDVGGSFTLAGDAPVEPIVRIPINSGDPIKFVWAGDLNGDGEYDFVLDRQGSPQQIEAYTSTGEFLWGINMGPNSEQQDNIEPGSAALNLGHWDGMTVYDFDSDGYAEVAVRIANGVVFGDGEEFTAGDDDGHQFIAIVDGQTGSLRASTEIPRDYDADGPLAARFGVGYLDGQRPHLISYMKNRKDDGDFNLMMAAWTFDGSDVTMEWKWLREDQDAPDGHNTRSIDADGDGVDEVHEIGFALNGDGSVKYLLGPEGVIHGDRFHIAKMDPEREGLQGFLVQQDHPDFLYEVYFDAADGSILWKHYGNENSDVGRGLAADVDPRYPGMEVWSFSGLYNAPSDELTESDTELCPWPHLTLFWDGDILTELYNDGKIEKWDPENPTASNSVPRILDISSYGGVNTHSVNPAMTGDIFGDWREEVIVTNEANDELLIFTTDQPSDIRLYTLAHNPAYRNSMTFKGYIQSHYVDYFIGEGMNTPPQPNIRYVGV